MHNNLVATTISETDGWNLHQKATLEYETKKYVFHLSQNPGVEILIEILNLNFEGKDAEVST